MPGALYLFDCLIGLMLPNPLGPVSLALLCSDLCFPESAYLALMLPRDWRLHWSLLRLDFRFAEIMSDTSGFCSANTKLCVQSPCQILALGLIKRLMHWGALGPTMWVKSFCVACLFALTQVLITFYIWQSLPDSTGSMTTFLIFGMTSTNSTRFAMRLRRYCKKLGDLNCLKVGVWCRNALSAKS